MSALTPERIERLGDTGLKIRWEDGHESVYTWTSLRASCPCASCREGVYPNPDVKPMEIKPVGHYAMAIRWSDGHTTGIFSFEYLRSQCTCEACSPEQNLEG